MLLITLLLRTSGRDEIGTFLLPYHLFHQLSRKALYRLELEPALYKNAGRFLVECCGQSVFNAADRAVNILNTCSEGEFLEVISNTKDGLVGFEPDIIIFRMSIAERKAKRAWLPCQPTS